MNNDTSKTNTTAAPLDAKPDLVKRIGNTTFDIHIHFSETSRETFTDKVVRLITVTGKGAYKGKAVVPFTISAKTIENANDFMIKEIKPKTFNGKLQKPVISVIIQLDGKSKKLSKKDYKVTYKDNFHAGEATILVTGKGNYAGLSATAKFTINPQQIKKASLKGTQGKLTLTYARRKLKEGYDYEISQYGALAKNKVEVTIKGAGDFTGTLTKNVKIQ